MPRPSRRSRTLRRIYVRTPGSKTVMQYRKRKPARAQCARCGKFLAAVPNQRPHVMKKLAKTKKRPQRPMGGMLCSACARRVLIARSRVN